MKRILTALAACAALGANAANPIFTDTFTADPAPIVVGDTCYVVELVAKKNTSPVVWFASRDDKFRSGAAYRDGKKMAKGKDNKETVDFGMALYGKARGI